MENVLLGLGSNSKFKGLGPCEILAKACSELGSFIKDIDFSSVYRTAAMYVTDQEDFYNMVVTGSFNGSPRELLNKIHEVENLYGRDRSKEIRFGPRSLDIDIERFGELEISEKDLIIPHERMLDRAFVLVPYLEILGANADENIERICFYENCLSRLSDQRIDLFMDKNYFGSMID